MSYANYHPPKRHKPRCPACDKWLLPKGDVMACPECGEILVRIDVTPPSPEYYNDGWGTTGTKDRGYTTHGDRRGKGKKPRRQTVVKEIVTQGGLFDDH